VAQYEMNLRDYWMIIRRRRLIIITSTVLVALFSFWFARQKVPVYQATATVKFEQSTQLSGLLVEVLSYSSADNIETQVTLIKSYPILEEVAKRLGRLPETASGEALRESKSYWGALDAINSKLKVARVPSTSILDITATSTNQREARDLANAVSEVYRDYNRAQRNVRVTEARKFIEGQLKEVEGRVKRGEAEVWAFREANRIISPGAESSVLLSLFTQVRGDIEKARQQRTELELVQERLARIDPASTAERVFVETSNPAMQRLQAIHSELLLERGNLALEVTGKHPRLQALDDRMRETRVEMRREVAAQISSLRTREEILNRQMGELLQKNREVPAIELAMQRLQREAKSNDDILGLLKTKHQEALIKESEKIEEVAIVRPATETDRPVGAETLNTVLVGALLGLSLGLVLAFVQETLDTSIGTIEDVEAYLEVPVLGIVPHIDARETVQRILERRPSLAQMDPEALLSHALLITHFDPKSPVAEAYRTLRTNIQFARLERAGKILVVSSPTLQEGKTTTIVNLALTMAQAGQRTLLVGANMRRPSIHRFFGIEREPGLSDILVGGLQWRDCIRTVADILMGRFEMEDIMAAPGLDNLHIIEAGPIPANPSELLSTPAMAAFLSAVRDEYDIVLLDTPPILPVTDSAIVASQADGVILVYQAGKVGRLVLKRAKVHIENVGGKVWGVVLNDVKTEIAGYAYTHYYTHYYGEETVVDSHKERLARVGTFVRRLLGRDAKKEGPGGESPSGPRGAPAKGADPGDRPAAPSAAGPAREARRPSGRPRRGLLLVVLALLAGVGGVAVFAWRAGLLPSQLAPKALLRQKLEAPRAPAPVPRPTAGPAPVVPAPVAPALAPPRPITPSAAPAPPRESAAPGPPVPAPRAPAPVPPPTAGLALVVPAPVIPAPAAAPPITPSAALAPPRESAAPGPPVAAPHAEDTTPARAAKASAPNAKAPAPAVGAAPATPPAAGTRFAVEFGPFMVQEEAERVERQLGRAGYPTLRIRQPTGAAVYAVLIEMVPTAREAQALVASLREQGFGEASVLGGSEPLAVRVGALVPLRAAVQTAERLRAAGHRVRVSTQPGEAAAFVLRHGNFSTSEDAEAKRRELVRLGLAPQVVRVK
jgi:succinoglycan biosynthesis transport protein ExoP